MLAAEVPSPLKGLLRNFNPLLSKPQQDNLARIVTGMLAYEGEKYVSKINDTFIPHKDQSNLNRFITDPKWNYRALNKRRIKLVEDELDLRGSTELCYLILDDTNVERYSGEGVGYHHDSKHGIIKGHNYVTEVCTVNDDETTYPIDLRLYISEGSSTTKKPFENKIDLACQMVDEFNPPSRHVIAEFDEWYFCGAMAKHAEDRGFDWISEAKRNRILFLNEERLNVSELLDRSRPFFRDVEVNGELYQCLDTEAFIPKMGGKNTRIVFNCRAGTKDIHFTCTNILKKREPSTATIIKHALKRARIESFHWDIKNVLGFEDYRFRESDAAIIHSHLVLLAYSLLLILNKRMERRESEQQQQYHSIGDACRRIRDRCLVAVCRWFKDRILEGLTVPNILGMINPQIRIYK
jgi:hypothetical protein